MIADNIIIGKEIVSLEDLGIRETEICMRFTFKELTNDKGNVWLPHLLVKLGVFKSTNECNQINKQRQASSKFNKDPSQDLWRNIENPEFTHFKIGKKVFCLIVGE